MAGERTIARVFLNTRGHIEYEVMLSGLQEPELEYRLIGALNTMAVSLSNEILENAEPMEDGEAEKIRKLLDGDNQKL